MRWTACLIKHRWCGAFFEADQGSSAGRRHGHPFVGSFSLLSKFYRAVFTVTSDHANFEIRARIIIIPKTYIITTNI